MSVLQASTVRNRLLTALDPDDYASLQPKLERVPLPLGAVLVEANQPIRHVTFPESGIAATIADVEKGRIEVGLIGREGFVGTPVLLGADRAPHTSVVCGAGEGLRISTEDFWAAITARPAIFRPLGLFVQALIVQTAQTAYVNATSDIEARLARWIVMIQDRVDGDELPLTHEFLSMMLGVRRSGVTIATRSLEGMGLIRKRRGRIEVLDREKLAELAGDAYRVVKDEYERLMAGGQAHPIEMMVGRRKRALSARPSPSA